MPRELYGESMGLRWHGEPGRVQEDPKALHVGLKNTKWLMPDPHSNSICNIVIRGKRCQHLWPCREANPGAELGVFVVPPEVAFTPRTRADLHCPAPAIVPYLLQVEAVNLPQALEPPDSTDVLPVQADSRGGQQLRGSRGRGGARDVLCAHRPLPASLGGEGGLCADSHRLSGCRGSTRRGRFLMSMRLSVRVTPGDVCSQPVGNPR